MNGGIGRRAHTNTRTRWARRRTIAVAATAATAMVVGAIATPALADQSDAPGRVRNAVELGSMYSVVDQIGARKLWQRGITGEGVNVAVIDTGVAPVAALTDKVVAAVDLSSDAGNPALRYLDAYGHGTHMAGIIAGRSPGADTDAATRNPDWFLGVAPDAGIVSVKVAGVDGATDITQVIAGVDWVVDHADELDIRVLNLAYSSGSILGYETDPLAYALERAWRAGIVVVVASGNDGRQARQLGIPAADPYLIAVGAAEAVANDRFVVPSWASSGDGVRNPDVSAPGAHIESLRVPGSFIDQEHPEGYVDDQIFRGSGTSQAAAVVAGAAALLLDADPDLTPDEVKALLREDAETVAPHLDRFSGAGVIQLDGLHRHRLDDVTQSWPLSDGSGSLDDARGEATVTIDGEPLVGDVTVLGAPWDGVRWTGVRWTGGEWDGVRWTGGEWMGVRWTDATWTGEAWLGVRWTDSIWSGVRWTDDSWTGVRWTGVRWTGVRWTDEAWSGVRWTDGSWDGVRWTGVRWSGVRWSARTWT